MIKDTEAIAIYVLQEARISPSMEWCVDNSCLQKKKGLQRSLWWAQLLTAESCRITPRILLQTCNLSQDRKVGGAEYQIARSTNTVQHSLLLQPSSCVLGGSYPDLAPVKPSPYHCLFPLCQCRKRYFRNDSANCKHVYGSYLSHSSSYKSQACLLSWVQLFRLLRES